MFTQILDKLKEILDANTLIQEVFKYEVEQFTGDPAVVVTPSGNISDYDTTQENVRIYAFKIQCFINRTEPVRTKKKTDELMMALVDSIIDDLDRQYTLSGITNPTGYTFINLFASPSDWGYIGERESEYRFAEITVTARVAVDLSSIS